MSKHPPSLRLQVYLHIQGITATQFSELLGVTPRTVRNWLKEECPPQPEHAARIKELTHIEWTQPAVTPTVEHSSSKELLEYLTRRKVSKREFAYLMKVSRNSIDEWLAGTRNPNPCKLGKLKSITGIAWQNVPPPPDPYGIETSDYERVTTASVANVLSMLHPVTPTPACMLHQPTLGFLRSKGWLEYTYEDQGPRKRPLTLVRLISELP